MIVVVVFGFDQQGVDVFGEVLVGVFVFIWLMIDWMMWFVFVLLVIVLIFVMIVEGLLVLCFYVEKYGYLFWVNCDLLVFGVVNVVVGVQGSFFVGLLILCMVVMDQVGLWMQFFVFVFVVGIFLFFLFGIVLFEDIFLFVIGVIVGVVIILLLGI